MADSPEETDDAAAAESAGDADSPPTPLSRPDVGATRAALDAVVKEKDHVHVENNLLSDHLMVCPSRLCLSIVPSLMSCSGHDACVIIFSSSESIDTFSIALPQSKVLDPSPATKSRTTACSAAQRYFTMISSA